MLNHREITISDEFVQYFGLNSNVIDVSVIEDLIEYDEGNELKVAPHLKKKMLENSQFAKMAVAPAKAIISRKTGYSLEFMVAHNKWSGECLPTAVYCQVVGLWTEIMCCKSEDLSFSLRDPEKYKEKVEFLELAANFICSLKYGRQRVWKPFQKGVALSTKTILWAADHLLTKIDDKLQYFMAGRALADPIESFHSEIRQINKNPTPLNYMRYVKVVSICQVLSKVSHGFNYEYDNSEFLSDFKELKKLQKIEEQESKEDQEENEPVDPEVLADNDFFISSDSEPFDLSQAAALAYVVGYVLTKTISPKGTSKCEECQDKFIQQAHEEEQDVNQLIVFQEHKEGHLLRPSQLANKMLQSAEALFITNRELYESSGTSNMQDKLTSNICDALHDQYDFPSCHIEIIVRRFLKFRIHQWTNLMNTIAYRENKDAIRTESMASRSSRSATASQLR